MSKTLSELFEEKLKEVNDSQNSSVAKEGIEQEYRSINELCNDVLHQISNIFSSEYNDDLSVEQVFYALTQLFDSAKVETQLAQKCFHQIKSKLCEWSNKNENNGKIIIPTSDTIQTAIAMLEIFAHSYFKSKFLEQFKGFDYPKKLSKVKIELKKLRSNAKDSFWGKALLEIQEEIEDFIAIQKEEVANSKYVEDLTNPQNNSENKNISNNKTGERETRQKKLGLTQDRAVWAMDYLFKLAYVNCPNTEKAKFISFLTGFSEDKVAQTFSRIEKMKYEIEEKDEISKKNSDDYKVIRKQFEILGLTEIQNQIDNDFGN